MQRRASKLGIALAGGAAAALLLAWNLWPGEPAQVEGAAAPEVAATAQPALAPLASVAQPAPSAMVAPGGDPQVARQAASGSAQARLAALRARMQRPHPPLAQPELPQDPRARNVAWMQAQLEHDRRLGPYIAGAKLAHLSAQEQETLTVLLFSKRRPGANNPFAEEPAADPDELARERSQTLAELMPAMHQLLGAQAMSRLVPAAMRQPLSTQPGNAEEPGRGASE